MRKRLPTGNLHAGTGNRARCMVYMHHKTGYRVPVRIRSFPIRDKTTGKITGSVEIFSDDSQHRAMTSEVESLRQEAHTDALTGIGNRRYADLSLETTA